MGKTTKSKCEYTIDEAIEHFLKLKVVKDILVNKTLSNTNREELYKFFSIFPYSNCYDQICKNIAYFIKYNLDDFYIRLYKLRQLKKNSREWFKTQLGEAGIFVFEERYINNINLRIKNPSTKSSKAALKFFKYIDSVLIENKVNVKSFYEDPTENNHEFRIRDNNLKWFCYDYTIKKLKIIIEYHGEHCHPKITDINTTWRHFYTKEPANIVYAKDQYKKNLAESNGYKYYVVWHNDAQYVKNKQIKDIFEGIHHRIPIDEPKRYRKFILTMPNGECKIVNRLSDIIKEFKISEYFIRKLLNGSISEYQGFQLKKYG